MSDRFDLEQQIMNCWNVVEDLKVISSSSKTASVQRDLVDAVAKLYQAKFESLFNTFEEVVANKKI